MASRKFTPAPRKGFRTNWCGPYAMAAILHTTYENAEALYRQEEGDMAPADIRGTVPAIVVSALGRAGLFTTVAFDPLDVVEARLVGDTTYMGVSRPPTLAQWLREWRQDKAATYLVQVTGHWVVVGGRQVIDNHMKTWTAEGKSKHRRRRVQKVWRVDKPKGWRWSSSRCLSR